MNDLVAQLDVDRIREAVAAAEGRTAGEIVPYVIVRSDAYEAALWRGAFVLALLSMACTLLVHQLYEGWGFAWLFTGWGVALVTLLGGAAGAALVAFVPPVKRWLAGPARLDRAVHEQAMKAFVEEEVFNTRDRTGILLFVSLFEHRIEVVGDSGINAKVSPEDWIHVVERIRDGIRSGHVTDGFVDAIGQCGELLRRKGVEIRPDDDNELPDSVRIHRGDG